MEASSATSSSKTYSSAASFAPCVLLQLDLGCIECHIIGASAGWRADTSVDAIRDLERRQGFISHIVRTCCSPTQHQNVIHRSRPLTYPSLFGQNFLIICVVCKSNSRDGLARAGGCGSHAAIVALHQAVSHSEKSMRSSLSKDFTLHTLLRA